MKKDSVVYTLIFAFLVCLVFVLILALVNEATKGRVADNRRMAERRAVLEALGLPFSDSDIDIVYDKQVQGSPLSDELYQTLGVSGPIYAKRFTGAGLWGAIDGILAVDEKVERIVGFRLISQNETPGLGGRIEEDWFQDQFSGELIVNDGVRVRIDGGGAPGDGVLDAITGATRTSSAVETIVNAEIAALRRLFSQGAK